MTHDNKATHVHKFTTIDSYTPYQCECGLLEADYKASEAVSDNKARDELKERVAFTVGEENHKTIDIIMKEVDAYTQSRVEEAYKNGWYDRESDYLVGMDRIYPLTDNQERRK